MADENENESVEETTQEPAAEQAAEAPEAVAEEAPAAEAAEAPEAAAEEAPAAEADEAPADDAPAEPAAGDEAAAGDAVPATPKERRRASRAKKASRVAVAKPRTPEERQAARDAERARKTTRRRAARAKARAAAAEHRAAHPGQPTPPREHGPGTQKVRQGVVVSDKADKTITVRIDVTRRHRRYAKIVRSSTTLHAHDEANDAHIGDTVVVRESRPLSRSKRWRLVEVVERAK
jgi:small subunit ribosomal protein S17